MHDYNFDNEVACCSEGIPDRNFLQEQAKNAEQAQYFKLDDVREVRLAAEDESCEQPQDSVYAFASADEGEVMLGAVGKRIRLDFFDKAIVMMLIAMESAAPQWIREENWPYLVGLRRDAVDGVHEGKTCAAVSASKAYNELYVAGVENR